MPLALNSSVAELLKKETHVQHLESEALLTPRLGSINSTEDYAFILRIFYGFFHPLEQRIAPHINTAVLEDINERRNATLALHDLNALHYSGDIITADDLPSINDLPSALGALYVMEGSTLGGRVIKKMLMKNDALSLTENQLQFFNGYGEETGPKWLRFQNCLNQYGGESETIIASAKQTFLKFSNWIRKNL